MIGYVQDRDIPFWFTQVETWINGLATAVSGWSVDDKLRLATHRVATRVASLQSEHQRDSCLDPILIDPADVAFDDFAGGEMDADANRRLLGLG